MRSEEAQALTVVAGPCGDEDCAEGELALRATESTLLHGRAVGLFRALRTDDTPGRVVPFATVLEDVAKKDAELSVLKAELAEIRAILSDR